MSLHLILEEDLVFQVRAAKQQLQTLVDLAAPRAAPDQPERITFEAEALWSSLSHINELLQSFIVKADKAPVTDRADKLKL